MAALFGIDRVTGRLRQRSWRTPEGEQRSVTEIAADDVGPSL
jgi:single-strand DNA-binding protein